MKLVFDDLSRYRQAALNWGLDFTQLDSGPLCAELSIALGPHVMVGHTRLNRVFYQQGETPAFGRTFGLFMRSTSNVRWLSGTFEDNTIAVFPVDRAFESHSSTGFDALAITVEFGFLETVAQLAGLESVLQHLPDFGVIYSCEPQDVRSVRACAARFLELRGHGPSFSSCEFELVRLILGAINDRNGVQKRPSMRKRDRSFDTAIEIIKDGDDEALDLATLCGRVGASERTLRYAFMEKTGMPPAKFLRLHRLNRARLSLLARDPRRHSVSEIARLAGFWHMGQFARDYRALFDELPSQTLKRAR